jgi:hypothetical protein
MTLIFMLLQNMTKMIENSTSQVVILHYWDYTILDTYVLYMFPLTSKSLLFDTTREYSWTQTYSIQSLDMSFIYIPHICRLLVYLNATVFVNYEIDYGQICNYSCSSYHRNYIKAKDIFNETKQAILKSELDYNNARSNLFINIYNSLFLSSLRSYNLEQSTHSFPCVNPIHMVASSYPVILMSQKLFL